MEVRPVVLAKDEAAIDNVLSASDANVPMRQEAPWNGSGNGNCGKPNIMFLRHKSGPYYLYHEIAHWRVLRHHEDAMAEPALDTGDIGGRL